MGASRKGDRPEDSACFLRLLIGIPSLNASAPFPREATGLMEVGRPDFTPSGKASAEGLRESPQQVKKGSSPSGDTVPTPFHSNSCLPASQTIDLRLLLFFREPR